MQLLLLGFLLNIGVALYAMDDRDRQAAIASQIQPGQSNKQAQLDFKDDLGLQGIESLPLMDQQNDFKETSRSRGSQLSPVVSHQLNSWLIYWLTLNEKLMGQMADTELSISADIAQKVEVFMGAPMPVLTNEAKKHLEFLMETVRTKKKVRPNSNRSMLGTLQEKDEDRLSELDEEGVCEDVASSGPSSDRSTLPRQERLMPPQIGALNIPRLNLTEANVAPLDYLFPKEGHN